MALSKDSLARLKEAIEALEPATEHANEVPNTAPVGIEQAADPTSRYMSQADRIEMRSRLKKLSTAELWSLFQDQATQRGNGVPADSWVRAGGNQVYEAVNADPTLRRALDTTGATALIRQDLEPILYELYIRSFPAWDRMAKEPANGLVHAYNRQTTFGDAQFMTELGTVTDDTAVYERATTPVSVLATRRGVSLKSQFATLQGGAGFNPEQLELRAGLRAIAHKMQKTIFQGNATISSGTAADQDGLYDANAFDGLRRTLNGVVGSNVPVDVDPFATTPEDMRQAFNNAAVSAMQAAGSVDVIYISPESKALFDHQQDKNIRYMSSFTEVAPGILTNAVNTVFGPLPLFVVPGDSIGTYTYSANTVSDAYLIDSSSISVPYLGSEGPTTLEIPIGISGQLTHLYIIFGMWGFAVKAIQFNNKVRIAQS